MRKHLESDGKAFPLAPAAAWSHIQADKSSAGVARRQNRAGSGREMDSIGPEGGRFSGAGKPLSGSDLFAQINADLHQQCHQHKSELAC